MDLLLSKKLSESNGLVNSDGFMMNASRRLSLGEVGCLSVSFSHEKQPVIMKKSFAFDKFFLILSILYLAKLKRS